MMQRRTVLMLALAAVAGAACGRDPVAPSLPVDPGEALPAARALGAAWRASGKAPRSIDAIAKALALPTGPAAAERARAAHRADLQAGRVVLVEGWVLSRTEALIYAWVSLLPTA